jgi:hypothetical protein
MRCKEFILTSKPKIKRKKKINSRGRKSYTATGLADDESDAILLNFIDDFLPHRHDRKMRET